MGKVLVKLKGFQNLTSVEEASKKFLNMVKIQKLNSVSVPLHLSLNRVLAEDIIAEADVPRFDRSAVDGYAVRAEETFGASEYRPRKFRITEKNDLGELQTKRVWTGNPIPKEANAVAMLENVTQVADEAEIFASLTPGDNISKKGEDISKGEGAVEAGTRLRPQHLGLIAALGIGTVQIFERPKIAILATGNELVEVGEKPHKNQIFEVNRIILSALCRELGAEPVDLGIAKDDFKEITEKMKKGIETADAVVTSGGTSVGASDLVPDIVNKMGKPGVLVHGVAMRPGMPTALAAVNGKPIVILPGNPVAAVIGFEVFCKPLICRLLGLKREESRPVVNAKMTRKVATALGRKTFVRVRVFQRNKESFAEPVSARGSGIISTMTKSNGYVVVPENREGLDKGEYVDVYMFDNVEVIGKHV